MGKRILEKGNPGGVKKREEEKGGEEDLRSNIYGYLS